MKDDQKTKKQLIYELAELRSQNAALKKSESAEKYRSLVENISDVIYELDSRGVVLYISPAIRDMLGYDSSEIVGKNFIEIAYKDDLSSLAEWFSELRKGKESPSEYRVSNKSGELRWARIQTRSIMEDGLFKGAQGILIDVTEQRRVEEALRESEAKYRLIAENTADLISILDMNLRFTYVSPATMRLRGFTVEEAMEQTLEQVLTPESMRLGWTVFEEEMQLEASGTADPDRMRILELEEYKKDGSIIWMEVSLSFLRDKDRKPVEILMVSRDITDRKRSEEALRERDILFMKLSSWVPGMIYQFTKRPDGTYCVPFTTETIMDIFGCSPQDVREDFSPIARVILPEDFDKVVGSIEYSAKHLTIWTCEYRVQIPGQSIRWVLGKSTPEKSADGSITWYGFNTDITERKKAEVALRETLESLRKAFGTIIQVMVSAVETRDPYTAGHQIRSADLARAIATDMGLPLEKIEGIRMAGSIHDIGKLSIPAEILSKPTKLSDLEFSLIKEHCRKGYEMLKDVESPWPLAEIVRQHHERMDGSGYPRNLKGDDILIEARILAVADVVEAMASHRPYRPGLGIDAALKEIEKNKGIFYDDAVAEACLRLFREKSFKLEWI